MNNHETNFEQNLARLLQASCGPDALPSPAAKEQLRRKLLAAQCSQRQSGEFPATALGLLTALVFALLAICGLFAAAGATGLAAHLANSPLLAVVAVNVFGIPFASLAIVLRRKYA